MTEFQVNTYTNNEQVNPTVAIDATGDFVITWTSYGQDGSGNGIYAQRYNSAGVAQGNEFQVNTTTSGDQINPTVAMDNAGDFVVSWQSSDGSGNGIYAQRYSSAGVAQGNEFKVNTSTSGDQINPTVAIDATGDFVISWQSQDGSGTGIYAQRYNSAGVAQGNEFRVNTYTGDNQINPTVAMDAAGDFVISWQSYYQDDSYYGIYAQRYNSAGVAQGNEFKVNTYTAKNQANSTVAMDATGNFVISWQSLGQDGASYGIYAQRYSSAGVAQGNEFKVNTYTTSSQANPTVAINSNNGDFVISWTSDGQDGSSDGIYAQRYNSAGVAQGNEFRVNTYTDSFQNSPTVALAANGEYVIAWQSLDQDGSNNGIYAQVYNGSIPPTITSTSASALGYTENAITAIDSNITVSDTDSPNLASATVTITNGLVSAQDILAFTDQNGITGSYNSNTGVLTLTGSSSVANYQTALRSITYTNSSDDPNTTPRTISFIVNDGTASSTALTRNINITAVNDAAVATGTNAALTYTEKATTVIDSGITVSDVDSANLVSASVSISSGFVSAQDVLAFTNQNGITGNYNSNTGVLTLTGSSSLANYQNALRSITYTNSSDNPSTTTRTVSFIVNDGTGNSTAITRNINITAVNNAPVATATNSALVYTENATTPIDSGITVSDVDSPNLASATVSITSGFVSAQDTLAFTNQNGITGSYNSSTGVLTLTGSATVANYQTALQSITYTNSSDNPSTTPRTVSFIVNDGTVNSIGVTRNINITAVNDAPVAVNDKITTNKNTPLIISATSLLSNDTDVDISDVLSIASFTQPSQGSLVNNNNGTYTYTPGQNYYGSDGFTYTISDGHGGSSTATVNLTINEITPPINGTSGADNLTGTVNGDSISGLLGNDTLQGLGDSDTLDGGDGNDSLDGGTGDDSLIGGKGNDTYIVDSIGDTITEGLNAGTDLVKSSVSWVLGNNLENLTLTGTDTINGTGNSLNNILTGNTAANILSGENGNDNLISGAGNDTLLGGAGNDTLDGGLGADSLIGGIGNDIYIVDNAGDTITEGLNAGTDLVKSSVSFVLADNVENLTLTGTDAINGTGNSLKNILIGNTGANILSGGDGNDSLFGSSGNDTLLGGAGDDTLDGGLGTDSLNGGAGNDTYTVDNLNDTITEGLNAGIDLVKSSVSWVLADNVEKLTLTGSGVINGTGNNLDNVLIGNTAANILSGGDGNDSLIGGAGNDSLIGGAGDDTLDGGAGIDSLNGGAGNDTYTIDNLKDTIAEGLNAGIDLVKSSVSWVLGDNLENLTLTGSATIGTGNSLDNILIGNGSANTLTGGDGKDSLFGSSGNDTLLGGTGDDTLDGGAGIDSLNGGDGNDIYTVDNLSDIITEGLNAGTDLVNSSVSWVLGDNLENLTLTGTGAITGTGNSLNNILTGNTGANTLIGGDGNDRLFGNSGNDSLVGGIGDDSLYGGVGKDTLTGGTGRDSLYLTDTRTGGYDTITDFTGADDTIFISKAEFGLSQAQDTTLDQSLFRLGTIATIASDRFIYNQSTGSLFFDKDGLGGTAQVQIAQFSNNALLGSANITVIA
ncbi:MULTISPECIES: beta strand repeat-containing protein [unclassified Nostoc]|uniref:beta strand repeat-containing protein n=1 Tax=unclassified Nostoc TaxID=2593658 RepID=UPI000CF3512A|nr:cadherin-like domain-containing protein [Nostoc sp. 'Peltigera membranacea cyanobiont' N6]AVH62289.1 hemolysin-type calcium-binding repeat-containing protein [Nostoc sp. 'Peltigera membranacea cyanobiont' N6]